MLGQNSRYLVQLRFSESLVPTDLHRGQPKLCFISGFMNVHVRWFVWFGTVKSDPIALLTQDGRHWLKLIVPTPSDKPAHHTRPPPTQAPPLRGRELT